MYTAVPKDFYYCCDQVWIMKLLILWVMFFLPLQLCSLQFNLVTKIHCEEEPHIYIISDLYDDGSKELILSDTAYQVCCYDFSGSNIWSLEFDYPVIQAAAHDVDQDGEKELFFLEELLSTDYYMYRVSSVNAHGDVSWRKFIEVAAPLSPHFRFFEVDGRDGDEILIANQIISGTGFERFEFDRHCTICEVKKIDDIFYFLLLDVQNSVYRLCTLENDLLWEGTPCQREEGGPHLSTLLTDMFARAGIPCCSEKYYFQEGMPLLQSIPYVVDFTENHEEEQILVTEREVTSFISNDIHWSWNSPDSVASVVLVDMTGDGRVEIIIHTTHRWFHGSSLHILSREGEHLTGVKLEASGIIHPTDVDADGDGDLVIISDTTKRVYIYSNACQQGPMDTLPFTGHLKELNSRLLPEGYILYGAFLAIILFLILLLSRKRKKGH